MKPQIVSIFLITTLFCGSLFAQPAESGAAIVLNASGLVEAIAPDGKKVPGLVKRGSVLTEGFTIKTGAFAESVLLFSNGTVATLNEKTTIQISIFSQKPFEAGNVNYESMKSEPSESHLSLSLRDGSIVVQTKKLNDLSIFNIKTSEGVIRVKGTEFQLGAIPGKGIQLDVAESTVSFLPKGSGKPLLVNGGNGLDAGKGGTIPRPISPIAAQKISTKNRFAAVIAAKVPLATIKQASAKAQAVAGRVEDSGNEDYEVEYEDPTGDEREQKSEKALAKVQSSSRVSESLISDNSQAVEQIIETVKQQTSKPNAPTLPSFGASDVKHYRFEGGENDSLSILFYASDPSVTSSTDEDSLNGTTLKLVHATNSEITETLVFANGKVYSKFQDPDEGTIPVVNDDYDLVVNPDNSWTITLKEGGDTFKFNPSTGTGSMTDKENGIEDVEGSWDFTFSVEPIQSLNYDSAPSVEDLKVEFAKFPVFSSNDLDALAVHVFTTDYFDTSKEFSYRDTTTGKVDYEVFYAGLNDALSLAKRILLDDATYNSSADFKVEKGNELHSAFLAKDGYGEQASRIIGHYASSESRDKIADITSDVFSIFDSSTSTSSVAFGTKKTAGTVALNTTLLADKSRDDAGTDRASLNREIYKTSLENLSILPGKDITLGTKGSSATFDLTTHLKPNSAKSADRKSFAITATDDLHLNGDITFKNDNSESPGHDVLLLGAADHIEGMQDISTNQKITNEGTHLVMGSYSHLTARNVDITTGGKLAIGALHDLNLDTVSFTAGRANKNDNITLYTDALLNLTNASFKGNAKEIYMQGTTINLTNINFETNKQYLLRSKDGAPHFDATTPKAGYVNFLGTNKWGNEILTSSHFNKLPDSAPVEGYNLKFNTDNTDVAGIRIRKNQ